MYSNSKSSFNVTENKNKILKHISKYYYIFKEVSEARQKLSSDRLKSTHIGGFSSTTANDLFGG